MDMAWQELPQLKTLFLPLIIIHKITDARLVALEKKEKFHSRLEASYNQIEKLRVSFSFPVYIASHTEPNYSCVRAAGTLFRIRTYVCIYICKYACISRGLFRVLVHIPVRPLFTPFFVVSPSYTFAVSQLSPLLSARPRH